VTQAGGFWAGRRAPTSLLWLSVSLLPFSAMAEDGCPRDNQRMIDERHGQHESGEYRQYFFKYESRVERAGPRPASLKLYIFCIENLHRNLAINFRWGDSIDDAKYFDSLVLPGKVGISKGTYLADLVSDRRTIKFKRTYHSEWHNISRETIYPQEPDERPTEKKQNLDEPRDNPILVATTPLSLRRHRHPISTLTDGDLASLSENKGQLRKFLEKEGKFELFFSTIIEIPANTRVSRLLHKRAYRKYKESDFIGASFSFYNTLRNVDDSPRSSIWYKLEPNDPLDKEKAENVLSNLELAFDLSPLSHDGPGRHPAIPNALLKVERLEKVGIKNILRQPAANLRVAEFQIRIIERKTKLELASLPIRVFISTD
jgi:hypothetical protein